MHLCKEIKNLTPGCGICIISVLVMILNNSGNERLMRAGSLFRAYRRSRSTNRGVIVPPL